MIETRWHIWHYIFSLATYMHVPSGEIITEASNWDLQEKKLIENFGNNSFFKTFRLCVPQAFFNCDQREKRVHQI